MTNALGLDESPDPANAASLFSAGARTDILPAAYSDSDYAVLDRRAGAPWDAVRATLDSWLERLPASARPQIRERFSRADRGDHLGAFWELYLHEAFHRLGFTVLVDIGNDAVRQRRPDLLVSREGVTFFVEATAVMGDDVWTPQETALADRLYDLINQADVPSFLVDVDIEEFGNTTPGRRDVVVRLEAWLNSLDPDALLAAERAGREPEACELRFRGWRVKFTPVPLPPDARGSEGHRVIGSQSGAFGQIEDVAPLRRKLKKKARHYGELDHPYLIAALCAGTFVDDRDISAALYGSRRWYRDPARREWFPQRERDGLWMGPGGPVNTRVAAVITATGLSPFAVDEVMPRWWTNPWAKRSLDLDLPWARGEATTSGAVTRRDVPTRPGELLGLPAGWPHSR